MQPSQKPTLPSVMNQKTPPCPHPQKKKHCGCSLMVHSWTLFSLAISDSEVKSQTGRKLNSFPLVNHQTSFGFCQQRFSYQDSVQQISEGEFLYFSSLAGCLHIFVLRLRSRSVQTGPADCLSWQLQLDRAWQLWPTEVKWVKTPFSSTQRWSFCSYGRCTRRVKPEISRGWIMQLLP